MRKSHKKHTLIAMKHLSTARRIIGPLTGNQIFPHDYSAASLCTAIEFTERALAILTRIREGFINFDKGNIAEGDSDDIRPGIELGGGLIVE